MISRDIVQTKVKMWIMRMPLGFYTNKNNKALGLDDLQADIVSKGVQMHKEWRTETICPI